MRILLLASEAPPTVSGVSRCVGQLSAGLTARGHEVDVLSSNEIPRASFGEVRLSSFVRRWPRLVRDLPGYDVVNVHGPAPTMSDVFLSLFRTLPSIRRPAVVYTHHSSIDLQGWSAPCAAYNWIHERLGRLADRIIVTSESYAELIAPGRTPLDIVPWGVDSVGFGQIQRQVRTDDAPLRVLFVGQMRQYKGLDQLLRAVAADPRLRLTLVGDGPREHIYRELAAALGAQNISFAGRVPEGELRRLYGEHDVVVLPSTTRAEAFGLALLEGMAAGCVPVASDLPGVRDVAGATGLLVRPGDKEDLARALLLLADDRLRLGELSVQSRARALLMGWDTVSGRYEDVFRDSLRQADARRAAIALPRGWAPPIGMLNTLVSRFGASWGSVLLFERSPQLRARAVWGPVPMDKLREERPRIAAYVADTRRPLLLNRHTVRQPIRDWLTRDHVVSALSVPLPTRSGAVGVLNLALAAPGSRMYTERHLDELTRAVAS